MQHDDAGLRILAQVDAFLLNIGVDITSQLAHAALSNPDHTFRELRGLVCRLKELSADIALDDSETTPGEIDACMRDFIQHQQRMIDQSNRDEFTVGAAKRAGAARIDAKELDLGTRMQLNVAHNTSGPLERSTVVADASSLPKQSLTKADAEAGLVQRVRGLESHLGLASDHGTLASRIKALEDRIQQIEESAPVFAAFQFSQADSAVSGISKETTDRIFSLTSSANDPETRKRRRQESALEAETLRRLDGRIEDFRSSLKQRHDTS